MNEPNPLDPRHESILKRLATMLKRRENSNFKKTLRQQLLDKASTLNETPKRHWRLDWENLWVKRLVPATAAALIVTLTVLLINPGGNGNGPQLVEIAAAQDYYQLSPVNETELGVEESSEFVLSSEGKLELEDVSNALTVTPAIEVKLEQTSKNEISITPAEPLESDTVYVFELAAQNLPDSPYQKEYSWAYQVSETFQIRSTFPDNESTHVPTNTGIEIYFNFPGVTVEALEDAFQIEPAVEGIFEMHDKIGVFAPTTPLEEEVIYTITIDGTLPLGGTEQILGETYEFQFETSGESRQNTYLNFSKQVFEETPENAPVLSAYLYGEDIENDSEQTVALTVYQYQEGEDYYEALQQVGESQWDWSYYSRENQRVSTADLKKVVDMHEVTLTENEWIFLPESLDAGYYVAEIQKNDATDQAFLQISNTATYLNLSTGKGIMWVNDLETGKPINGATVEFAEPALSATTDENGIAVFENLGEALELGSDYNAYFLKIETPDQTTYYQTDFYNYDSTNNSYWQFMDTDREVYLPTDTLNYWGFLQGRETPLSGEAELILVSGYVGTWTTEEELAEDNRKIDSTTIELEDGRAFSGKFSFEKLAPGGYTLVVMQEGTLIAERYFYIEHYTKPAYQLLMEPEKTMLFEGDQTNVQITSEFFEGTAVPNLELVYSMSYRDPEQTITTDENGGYEFQWTATSETCWEEDNCNLMTYLYPTVRPVKEELADIQGNASVIVLRSKNYADIPYDGISRDNFNFTVYKIDLDKINHDRNEWNEYDDFLGAPSANTRVDIFIDRVDLIKIEDGQYYDPIDKVMRTRYYYEREEVQVAQDIRYTDANGVVNYTPTMEEDHSYKVRFRVYDTQAHYYDTTRWIGESYTYDNTGKYLVLSHNKSQADDSSFNVGESVTVTAKSSNEEETLPTGEGAAYLFLESQGGIRNYSVESSPQISDTFTEDWIPNVYIDAVLFDGQSYVTSQGSAWINFNSESRRLNVEIQTDSESYEPGETVELTVSVTDETTGKPASAQVVLNLVDEAYYALYAQNLRDPLDYLYGNMGSGILYSYASVEAESSDDGGLGGCFVAGTQILMADGNSKNIEDIRPDDLILTRANERTHALVPGRVMRTTETTVNEYLLVNDILGVTEDHVLFINGQWQLAEHLEIGDILLGENGENIPVTSIETVHETVQVYNFEVEHYHTYLADGFYVHNDKGGAREDFRDTALYELIETDSNGTGTLSFELPDNITSWRVTGLAVEGGDIRAGFGNASVEVTKPLFALPVVNTEYLSGDRPQIPVRAYGEALSTGAEVTLGVEIEALEYAETQTGTAFENRYFTLPEMMAGDYEILVSATYNELEDLLIQKTRVSDSHLETFHRWQSVIDETTVFEGSSEERTEVYLINNEAGMIYGTLLDGAYQNGDRADEAVWEYLSKQWLNTYFDEDFALEDFPTFNYQVSEYGEVNGVALLPYAASDVVLSARMANVAPELWNQPHLILYFEEILDSTESTLTEKVYALYGLASLGEPVLNELTYFVNYYELDLDQTVTAALAYAALGDTARSGDLYVRIMETYGQEDTYETIKITTEEATTDQTLSWTASMAALAEVIGSDQRDALWDYILLNDNYWDHETRTELIHLEKLLFIKNRLAHDIETTVEFEWNGTSVTLENNDVYHRSVLPEELASLNITNLTGELRAFTFYNEAVALDDLETSDRIDITRTYIVNGVETNTFKPGDLVEIHFKLNIPNTEDFEGAYRVTDYLPSGLQTITQRSFASYFNQREGYRYPYQVDRQTLYFYVGCYETNSCESESFYYLARVINGGSFIVEPATLQSYADPSLLNVSSDRLSIEIDVE